MVTASDNRTRGGTGLRAKLATVVVAVGCVAALLVGSPRSGLEQGPQHTGVLAEGADTRALMRPFGRIGPADEYEQAERSTGRPATHGLGPADEYLER